MQQVLTDTGAAADVERRIDELRDEAILAIRAAHLRNAAGELLVEHGGLRHGSTALRY